MQMMFKDGSSRMVCVAIFTISAALLFLTDFLKHTKNFVLPIVVPRIRDIQIHPDGFKKFLEDESSGSQIRKYDWVIERSLVAPDGVLRDMITVNGAFPGPTIEANVGDTIQVNVVNRLSKRDLQSDWNRFSTQIHKVTSQDADSQVAIHWHGLSMRHSPEQDGAHGFNARSIEPGENTTYTFILGEEDVGTHWWHSHVGMTRSDGLWGLFIVRSNGEREDLQKEAGITYEQEAVLAFNDHYHTPGTNQLSWFMSTYSLGFEPTPESSLINGRNRFAKSRAIDPGTIVNEYASRHSHLHLRPGLPARLRLINTGAVGNQYVSIDDHVMKVVEADGVLVQPFVVQRLPVAPGQRYSVIIEQPKVDSNKFWIRTALDHKCFNMPNPALNLTALAVLSYDEPKLNASVLHDGLDLRKKGVRSNIGLWSPRRELSSSSKVAELVDTHGECEDVRMDALRPLLSSNRAPLIDFSSTTRASAQRIILYSKMPKLSEHGLAPMGFINGSSWRANNETVLQTYKEQSGSQLHRQTWPGLVAEVPKTHNESQTIEVVIHNGDDGPHPFHLHGHKFWIMEIARTRYAQSTYKDKGQWRSYDLDSAPLRDTVTVPRKGYAVLRWKADNPGVWPFHCHVLVHMASGMAMAFVDQPEMLSV